MSPQLAKKRVKLEATAGRTVTNGDEDEYYVGRPGLFIDVHGKEYACVVSQSRDPPHRNA